MVKRRDRERQRGNPAAAVAAPSPASTLPRWWIDAGAAVTAVLIVVLAWAARGNLNVDGVAYLELSHRLAAGDWSGFVQGYWSPLYPALLAVILGPLGATGAIAAAIAHALNAVIALAALALLHRLARGRAHAAWALLAYTALLVSSARTIRVDAVTPDLLLLLATVGLASEWLRPGGWRALPTGLWAAAAFLAKTSSWPWLIVVTAAAWILGWRDGGARRRLLVATAIAIVPIGAWTAAVSSDSGSATIGSAGRLNACWYLYTCDGRTPDTHRGDHQDYRSVQLAAGATARVAAFSDASWTYAPWSDPTAWQDRLVNQERVPPSVMEFASYWGVQLGLVVGLWSALLLALVIIPSVALTRGAPGIRQAWRSPAGLTLLAGIVGALQFVSVHAEPRLIAPFTMLVALGVLEWRFTGQPRQPLGVVAIGALLVAVGIGGYHVLDQARVSASSAARVSQLEPSHPPHGAPYRVAVIGPALPLMPDLYRAHAVVVAQVFEPDPAAIQQWTPDAQRALGRQLAALGAREVWISRGRSAYTIASLEEDVTP